MVLHITKADRRDLLVASKEVGPGMGTEAAMYVFTFVNTTQDKIITFIQIQEEICYFEKWLSLYNCQRR
jgi:hypothetical protein